MALSKREQLIETTLDLIYRDGCHATGVDRIVEESSVSKMTLYKYFHSKEELILAALRRRDEQFRNWFMREVVRRARKPERRLLAVFDVLESWIRSKEFFGCPFVNAAAEYTADEHPIHAAAAEHKRLMLSFVCELAHAAGANDPKVLAQQLCLLLEGTAVTSYITGSGESLRSARTAARVLVRDAMS